MKPEALKEHRRKLRERGICTRCHKNKVRSGLVLCAECRDSLDEAKYEMRKDKTRCKECSNRLDEFTLAIGQKLCPSCSERKIKNKRITRAWE